jgi:hypothetical protein
MQSITYDWVAYKDKARDRVYYANASEKISTYTVPRGTPPRKVQKKVQNDDGRKSLKNRLKALSPPESFAEGCLVFVADKEHVCRMALNRGAEFYAGDPARLEFYDGDKLSNKVCD